MSEIICSKCAVAKDISSFYMNPFKKNGLESNCKSCVLKRKAKSYKAKSKSKSPSNEQGSKRAKFNLTNCTFKEVWINRSAIRSQEDEMRNQIAKDILCLMQ